MRLSNLKEISHILMSLGINGKTRLLVWLIGILVVLLSLATSSHVATVPLKRSKWSGLKNAFAPYHQTYLQLNGPVISKKKEVLSYHLLHGV